LCVGIDAVISFFHDDLDCGSQPLKHECATPALELLQVTSRRIPRDTISQPFKHSRFTTGLHHQTDDGDVRDWGSGAWPGWPTPENMPSNVKIRDYSPPRRIKVLEWTTWNFYMKDYESFGLENCQIVENRWAEEGLIRDRDFR